MINKETLVNREKWVLYFYWSLPLLLFILQALYTFNSMNQIRYEELAESVRNVFWLQNRTIYDGVSSNVGWYGTLLLVYNFFGFDLYTAKIVRLLLQLISLLCLASVLKKLIGVKSAWIPLLTIGLSPALLFFNTLQAQFGIDLQYLPICLYLIIGLDQKKKYSLLIKQFLLGSIGMIALMSYPSFIFFVPALAILYVYKIYQVFKRQYTVLAKNTLITLFSALLPLAAAFLIIQNRQLLIYDKVTKAGLFRGAGIFHFDFGTLTNNLFHLLTDLFIQANSYYFEVSTTEFSQIYPIISVLTVIVISIIFSIHKTKYRFIFLLLIMTFIFNILVSGFTFDPSGRPGIRRNTASLAVFYAFFTLIWHFVQSLKWESPSLKAVILVIILFIPIHHLLAYPSNYMNLTKPSYYQYSHILNLAQTPQKTLNLLVQKIQAEDLKLVCQKEDGGLSYCRYSEIYPAVAGFCKWNGLHCQEILGYDERQELFIPLSPKLWEDYYFDH